jgi:hypothetical protein
MIVFFVICEIGLSEYLDIAYLNLVNQQSIGAPQGELSIVIKIPDRLLELYSDGKLHKKYRIAVGKMATPTPIGEWTIVYKGYSPKEVLGTRWLGLDVPWGSYGIHGTNRPWSIGSFASQGCIRMRNKDSEELYEWVPIGTPVKIVGPRDKVQRVLRRNAVGPEVIVLQLRLIELGYYQERADGRFQWETEAALRAFQRDSRLEETGVADRQTLRKMGL